MREMHKDHQRETETNEIHTRYLKNSHNHSDILNHMNISIMVSTLYDTASFVTDKEYRTKYPGRPPANVQAMVEKPFLYVLGQSSSSDIDQLSYIPVPSPQVFTCLFAIKTYNDVELHKMKRNSCLLDMCM